MSQWEPIDSAPKDGTAIWVAVDGWPYIGYCRSEDWLSHKETWFIKASFRRRSEAAIADDIFGTYAVDVHPTHWMPLPEPPK